MKELMNEGMKDMKKFMMIMVLGALMAYLVPAQAQNNQEWQTSTLQGSGSTYTPQVTPVGATMATSEATTTESYSPAKAPSGPRKDLITPGSPGHQSNESPIGDAVWPLLAMLAVYSVARVYRSKRRV